MLTGPRYTRRVILDGSSPYHSRGQLRSLDLELASFEESLPEELQLNDNRLMLMCHSDEARAYAMLHTLLFSCRCDLHRFLIPGIRECVSPEAAAQTPREYIDYCQRRCLQSALGSCDLWSKIRHLETSSRLETPTLAVVTYQSVKIIDHLASLLPARGDDSLPVVKEKLTDALFIVSRIQTGVDWIASCISDIEKLIPRLGARSGSAESPQVQETSVIRPSTDTFHSPPTGNLRLQEKLHRRSKHAYAPDDEEELDPAVNPPESNQEEPPATEDIQSATPIDPLTQGSWPFSLPVDSQDAFSSNQSGSGQPLGYNLMNYDLTNSADVVFGEHDMVFPMDPFDLQLNAYTDANVHHYIGSE
ncbi:Fungal-trans domain-containing protein [Fusarium keratoplasticum]|nr:Fungal-trans domain-containing protein [Fusarium keratoplasticum]